LGDVIGEKQNAFVHGRLITHNVLIAYESVHAKGRRKVKITFVRCIQKSS
jgi:hypothetical protein